MGNEAFFSHSFGEARRRFRDAAAAAGAQLDCSVHPTIRGEHGEELAQDIALFGPRHATQWLLALSGTHGPEGFAGAAIQLDWISRCAEALPTELGVALVHGVNPWGYACRQRTTERNIDLNRNFVDDATRLSETSNVFDEIAAAMAIKAPTPEAFATFNARRERLIERHGIDAYVNAFAKGQYSHPDGPFFGGHQKDWANESLIGLLKRNLISANKIAMIDWHTGLGEYGELFFLCFNEDVTLFQRAVEWWGEPVVIGARGFDGAQKPEYTGTVCQGVMTAFSDIEIVATVIEIGTYPFAKMSDAILVENWLRSPAGQCSPNREYWLSWTSEHFSPEDDAWRSKTITNGRRAMDQALQGLQRWSKEAGV